jgi:hypothetical protein
VSGLELLVYAALSRKVLVHAALSYAADLTKSEATGVCGLKLLVYRLKLLVYEALSY